MEASGEEVLGELMEKETYDLRGSQRSIFRVGRFDREALLHMITYRALIFVGFIEGVVLLYSSIFGYGKALGAISDFLLFVVMLIFIPEIFEMLKALAVISSRGIVFGHLNHSFLDANNLGRKNSPLAALPYLGTLIWIGVIIAFLVSI